MATPPGFRKRRCLSSASGWKPRNSLPWASAADRGTRRIGPGLPEAGQGEVEDDAVRPGKFHLAAARDVLPRRDGVVEVRSGLPAGGEHLLGGVLQVVDHEAEVVNAPVALAPLGARRGV